MPSAKLSAKAVAAAAKPGLLADGGGLYLQVTVNAKTGTVRKSWVFRFTSNGRTREMGLGPLGAVCLADARKLAEDARRLRASGQDPLEARAAAVATSRSSEVMTFRHVAEDFIAGRRPGWKNAKHADQWTSTLVRYVYPVFGDVPIDRIDTDLVHKVLEPIWSVKTETAQRVRGRIEQVLAAAKVRGLRSGDNPAQWRGHLDALLPSPSKVHTVQHFAALRYGAAPAFVQRLRERPGTSARALEFAILTAARTDQTLATPWSEVDLTAKVWFIPGVRMKNGNAHRVPLSAGALAILEQMAAFKPDCAGGYVFPGECPNRPMSNMAMLKQIERMGLKHKVTTHGFRSSFRDWAAEETDYPDSVVEKALAHAIRNKVEAAYRRGDLFEKRRGLMAEWDTFLQRTTPDLLAPSSAAANVSDQHHVADGQ